MPLERLETRFNGVPLPSIATIALDTETTGLNPLTDRIVQIGAVKLRNGAVVEQDVFDDLVNPGVPIPALSTAIHGIADDAVAGAPHYAEAVKRLSTWAGPALLVGYATGFDLAVMSEEHKRAGLAWEPPRFLDVRDLVEIVAPDLPEASLDTAGEWLGVDIKGRHTALGDARATAEIYLALLPKLAAKGIVTLSQAERASQLRGGQARAAAEHGWAQIEQQREGVAEYARIDSFPYRHRVGEIMNAPALFVQASDPLNQVLALMMRDQVSSVFLRSDGDGGGVGIITERDVLRAIDRDGAQALAEPVTKFATWPLASVDQDEFVYRAIVDMSSRRVRHLGVHDSAGEIVGALSARDLLKQRATAAVALGDSIRRAGSADELGEIWAELTVVARGLLLEEVDPRDVAAIVSRELCELTRKAGELAEHDLLEAGEGAPPCPYALLVLGSGGRGESMLAMDQDNAIVYQDGEHGDATDIWFEHLGARIADTLNSVGVPYCTGGVMARNPEWRMSLSHWRETVQRWMSRSLPEDILNADIFFDCRPVHGELSLGEKVRSLALPFAATSREFQRALASSASRLESPFRLFGRFHLTNGRVDLKKTGLFPIVATARILALRHGIEERSTSGRLGLVKQHLPDQVKTIDSLVEAHRILIGSVLRQQLRDLERGLKLSNAVRPSELSKHETQELRWALEQVPEVQSLLGTPLFMSE